MTGWICRRFDWSGSASRREFLLVFLLWLAAAIAFIICKTVLGPQVAALRYVYVGVALLLLVYAATLVRRLHDAGRSGGWAWLIAVPLLTVVVSIYAIFARSRSSAGSHWPTSGARKLGQVALVLLACVIASRAFWSPYWIPAGSMKPALLIGDYIAVRHVRLQSIVRGDILVFRHPAVDRDYIKRLVGLPGDTIKMRGGILYINGQEAPQKRAGSFEEIKEPQGSHGAIPRCANDPVGLGGTCIKKRMTETLPDGVSHSVLNIGTFGADDTANVTVPDGHFFFLGDNRDNSLDSRFPLTVGGLGFVPVDHVIGRAEWVLFSTSSAHLLDVRAWRDDRLLRAVK